MHASNEVIMPVLGMNQDTGKLIRWLAAEGQAVKKGQALFEVETDKSVAEIESPASGVLSAVKAQPGEDVPVGTVIALILAEGETTESVSPQATTQARPAQAVTASPVAAAMAAEAGIDLAQVRPGGGRVEKADVLAYLQNQPKTEKPIPKDEYPITRPLASPKARRLAAEARIDLASLSGSGPGRAVLAADVLGKTRETVETVQSVPPISMAEEIEPGTIWKIMAERTTAAWTSAPHFFLIREVDASRLLSWRESLHQKGVTKITYTDLLVKLAAAALREHPRVNGFFLDGKIQLQPNINIGLATAVEDGLVVPVIHRADQLSLTAIAERREELLQRARSARLKPEDISGGTFTISNLGMYGVDAFLAVLNPPQSAILAVGRITERVVAVRGQPVVRPMMAISLSFDHRAVDGARGALFMDTLAKLIEEPLGLVP